MLPTMVTPPGFLLKKPPDIFKYCINLVIRQRQHPNHSNNTGQNNDTKKKPPKIFQNIAPHCIAWGFLIPPLGFTPVMLCMMRMMGTVHMMIAVLPGMLHNILICYSILFQKFSPPSHFFYHSTTSVPKNKHKILCFIVFLVIF